MPRGIYNWSAEDVVRFLKARGFYLNYTKGSHYFYVGHAGGMLRQVCIPFHGSKVIKPRTLKGIIRQSGIPQSEWLRS
jgi:predicted RNA binding protein YcfA (HicA-like mRNA interferase family)